MSNCYWFTTLFLVVVAVWFGSTEVYSTTPEPTQQICNLLWSSGTKPSLRIQSFSLCDEMLVLIESDTVFQIPVDNIQHDYIALYDRQTGNPIDGELWYNVDWLRIREPSLVHLNQPGTLKRLDIHHWKPGPVLEYRFDSVNYFIRNGSDSEEEDSSPKGYLFPPLKRQSSDHYFQLVSDQIGSKQYVFQYGDAQFVSGNQSSQVESSQLWALANTTSQASPPPRVILFPNNLNLDSNQTNQESDWSSQSQFRSAYYFLLQTNSNRSELQLVYRPFATSPAPLNLTRESGSMSEFPWPRDNDLFALLPFGFISQSVVFVWSVGQSRMYTFDYVDLSTVQPSESSDSLPIPIQSYSSNQFFRCNPEQGNKSDVVDFEAPSQQDYLLDLQLLAQLGQTQNPNQTLDSDPKAKLIDQPESKLSLLSNENLVNVVGLILLIMMLMAVLVAAIVILGNYRTIQQRLDKRRQLRQLHTTTTLSTTTVVNGSSTVQIGLPTQQPHKLTQSKLLPTGQPNTHRTKPSAASAVTGRLGLRASSYESTSTSPLQLIPNK